MKPDGTRLFVNSIDKLYEYDISPSYNWNNLTKLNERVIKPPSLTDVGDIFFKPDGTVFYLICASVILSFPLGTPWDINTFGNPSSLNSGKLIAGFGMFISDDGRKMITTGNNAASNLAQWGYQ